ncbi:hypothetical protein F4677DRAFT_445568 [Hypoxylon crocopeplum]|nr:hypothetical protein F4677DRAFT_445568 [Hypoxylon crocopeplum]
MITWSWSEKTHKPNKERQSESSRNFLKVLVDPPEPASVDIVAVHGLNPLHEKLHAEATWTAGGKLWLKDFLPKRVPGARIMLFGYNSNVAFQTPSSGVREQAKNLLNLLEEARSTDPNRPLIFICHSLGGIIVKRAIAYSHHNKTYEMIGKSTFGVAFFATPHNGDNIAEIGQVAAKIACSVLGSPEDNLLSALERGSVFLDAVTDDFRQFLQDFQILSFYETLPIGHFGIVVDRHSAVLGLPGTREKQIPLDADHRNICKFKSEDLRYYHVEDNIVKMINNALSFQCRPITRTSFPEGNTSTYEGEYNTSLQAGYYNSCKTDGDYNKTYQFGDGNISSQVGNGNTTTQIGAGNVARHGEMFRHLGRRNF